MDNNERVKRAKEYKDDGNEKMRAGNVDEALPYYKEAYEYVKDLPPARRADKLAVYVPLCLNLARCYEKLDEKERSEREAALKLENERKSREMATNPNFVANDVSISTNDFYAQLMREKATEVVDICESQFSRWKTDKVRKDDGFREEEDPMAVFSGSGLVKDSKIEAVHISFHLKALLRRGMAHELMGDWESAAFDYKRVQTIRNDLSDASNGCDEVVGLIGKTCTDFVTQAEQRQTQMCVPTH